MALTQVRPAGIAPSSGRTLETLAALCDGQSYTVSSGTYTTTNVTAVQNGTTSYVDISGSSIDYTPPTGATCVIYEFSYLVANVDQNGIHHQKFFIDSNEVVDARVTESGGYEGTQVNFKWVIPIGGTADTDTGRQSSWSSAKTLKLQFREYGSSNEMKLHQTIYWDGAASSQFHRPQIKITALG
jgi:hypothetical protein|tara:strand:- start:331 stop:885 length:555 start_codon:yes stop_codon:yes gene_type:complete